MNPRRILSQIALVAGAFLLSAGVQTFAAFTAPTTAPPGADAYAPLHTGSDAQSKVGGLLLNTGGATNGLLVQLGNVGIGTTNPTQKLDVAGYVKGQTGICIGSDCRTSWPATPGRGQPVYMCPSIVLSGMCPTTCTGALSTNSTCEAQTSSAMNDCYPRETASCSFAGYLNP